jgi:hypothetical protein
MNELPYHLPQLRGGSHLTPEDGGCFMEYASVLAGESWNDQPSCTHPVLAALARLVNDATTPTGRLQLVHLIPYVVGVNPDDLRTAPALVDAAIAVVRLTGARGRSLRRHQRRAGRRLRRLGHQPPSLVDRWRATLYERGPAMRALQCLVVAVRHLPPGDRDEVLRAALVAGIKTARAGRPSSTQSEQPPIPEPTIDRPMAAFKGYRDGQIE